jgi:hypothetical protein
MMEEIRGYAIKLAKAHSETKYDVQEMRTIYPDRDFWTLFRNSSLGEKVLKLETKYDELRKGFKKRFREDYNPLNGRKNERCYGDSFCTLSVDGRNYDRPYNPTKISVWAPLAALGLVLSVGLLSVFVHNLVGNAALALLIMSPIALLTMFAFFAIMLAGTSKD